MTLSLRTNSELIEKQRMKDLFDFLSQDYGTVLLQGYKRGKDWWLCAPLRGVAQRYSSDRGGRALHDEAFHLLLVRQKQCVRYTNKTAMRRAAREVLSSADAISRLGMTFSKAFEAAWLVKRECAP